MIYGLKFIVFIGIVSFQIYFLKTYIKNAILTVRDRGTGVIGHSVLFAVMVSVCLLFNDLVYGWFNL